VDVFRFRIPAAVAIAASSLLPALCAASDGGGYTRNVAVVVYDGMEILDFAGPAEVFAAAGGFGARGTERAYRVYTVGRTSAPVESQGFIDIVPEYTIENSPQPDIVVLPGGGTDAVTSDPRFFAWVSAAAREADAVLTVCTGAFVAGRAGLLDGLEATTYYGALDRFTREFPAVHVRPGRRFVDNGRIVTTAGVSAGIDGALHFVARDLGRWVADRTAEYMEYRWTPESMHAAKYPQLNPRLDDRGRELQLAAVAVRSGEVERGIAIYRRLLDDDPAATTVWMELGLTLSGQRRYAEAVAAFERAAAGEEERGRAYFNLACAHALAGNRERALDAAERAVEAGFRTRAWLAGDPDLESIRDDPRFQALLARLEP